MSVPAVSFLLGEDYPELGTVGSRTAGAAALAVSPGRRPKAYRHVDPNEDAVLAATAEQGWLLAAADGHNGFTAARAAITGVADGLAAEGGWRVGTAQDIVSWAAGEASRSVHAAVTAAPPSLSRTALSLAAVVGDTLAAVTFGDTSVALIPSRRGAPAVAVTRTAPFLAPGVDAPRVEVVQVAQGDWVLVCSDGLVDYLGKPWLTRVRDIIRGADDAEAAARQLIETACDYGAGDHVGVALAQVGA